MNFRFRMTNIVPEKILKSVLEMISKLFIILILVIVGIRTNETLRLDFQRAFGDAYHLYLVSFCPNSHDNQDQNKSYTGRDIQTNSSLKFETFLKRNFF